MHSIACYYMFFVHDCKFKSLKTWFCFLETAYAIIPRVHLALTLQNVMLGIRSYLLISFFQLIARYNNTLNSNANNRWFCINLVTMPWMYVCVWLMTVHTFGSHFVHILFGNILSQYE